MDPLSVSASCVALVSAVAKASVAITLFVREVRDARGDLDSIAKELLSLRTVLELLAEDTSNPSPPLSPLSPLLQKQLIGIIKNCTSVVVEIESALRRHEDSRLGKAGYWVFGGKTDMDKLRSNLEAHKSALEIGLDMVTMSLARDIKKDTEEIKENSAAIKDDTAQILSEIARLQTKLLDDTGRQGSSVMLQRYLDNLTNYAESVCDTLVSELPAASPRPYAFDNSGKPLEDEELTSHEESPKEWSVSSNMIPSHEAWEANVEKDNVLFPREHATSIHQRSIGQAVQPLPPSGSTSSAFLAKNWRDGSGHEKHALSTPLGDVSSAKSSTESPPVFAYTGPSTASSHSRDTVEQTHETKTVDYRPSEALPIDVVANLPLKAHLVEAIRQKISAGQNIKDFSYLRYKRLSRPEIENLRDIYPLRPGSPAALCDHTLLVVVPLWSQERDKSLKQTLASVLRSRDRANADNNRPQIIVLIQLLKNNHISYSLRKYLEYIGLYQDNSPYQSVSSGYIRLYECTSVLMDRMRNPDSFRSYNRDDSPLQMMLSYGSERDNDGYVVSHIAKLLKAALLIELPAGEEMDIRDLGKFWAKFQNGDIKSCYSWAIPAVYYRKSGLTKLIKGKTVARTKVIL